MTCRRKAKRKKTRWAEQEMRGKKGRVRGWKWGSEAESQMERRQSRGCGQRERGPGPAGEGGCLSWEGLHGCGPSAFFLVRS